MIDDAAGPKPSLPDLSLFAEELAAVARRETLRSLPHERIADDKGKNGLYDPVTDADRAAEVALRKFIEKSFPDHSIYGEELPDKGSDGPYAWSLDPIDGTRSYVCGLPTWTTLIALLCRGEPILGLIDAPALDETYIGLGTESAMIRRGERAPISTSGCTSIGEARFSTTDPFLFGPAAEALQRVLNAVRVTRFGHDGYAYARLAAGSLDLVVECGLKPHDYNALIPVVRAAGGHIGDWRGGSDFKGGNVIAAATRELYDDAVELLGEA